MQIRDATVADADAIARVHVASWQAAYRGLLPDAVLDGLSVAESTQNWAERLAGTQPGAHILVVEDEGVIGFAAFGTRPEGAPGERHLWAMYLDPAQWGRGAGRPLHAAMVDRMHAAGVHSATLWVLRGNERAIRFYERAGWSFDGTSKLEVGPGGVELPVLLMRRPIGSDTT
ncbi:N-acetyltransferase family protein [Pseudonocardia sp. CA-107938]|uniref:GNAT family N-acetyltransferase n=1 Tax=Pseudonocardia sp. CA-107938 TaxID=3240021 RepID=UPI003D92F1BA